jgi:hypothetical protein
MDKYGRTGDIKGGKSRKGEYQVRKDIKEGRMIRQEG